MRWLNLVYRLRLKIEPSDELEKLTSEPARRDNKRNSKLKSESNNNERLNGRCS
jgi:hypothetical protein